MKDRLYRWIAPAFFAAVPLTRWGEDFRFSRWSLLLLACVVAWFSRPGRPLDKRLAWFLAAGPTIAFVSWSVHGFPALAVVTLAELTAFVLVIYTLLHDKAPEDFALLWMASIGGASTYGLLQALGVLEAPRDAYGKLDAAATFGLSNFAAETLAVTIPLGAVLMARNQAKWLRAVLPAVLLLQVAYLIMAGSRSAWVALLVAGLVALPFVWKTSQKAFMVAALLWVITAMLITVLGGARLRFWENADPSLTFRREAWKAALSMGLDQPWLGVGPGHFPAAVGVYATPELARVSVDQRRSVHHPHNEFLAAWAERGILGLLWLVSLTLTGIVAAVLRRAPWALAALVAAVVVAMFGFPFQQAAFAGALGLIIAFFPLTISQADEAPARHLRWVAVCVAASVALLFAWRAAASNLARRGAMELEASRRLASKAPSKAETLRSLAQEHLRKAIEIWPTDPEAVFNLAIASAFNDEQTARLRDYLAMMPGDVRARIRLAQAEQARGNTPEAESQLRQALSLAHHPPVEAYHNLVGLAVARQDYGAAVSEAEAGLVRYPDSLQLLLDKADALRWAGRHEQAATLFEQILKRKPTEAGIYLRAGLTFGVAGRYGDAEQAFLEGSRKAPKEPVYLVFLAQIEHARGRDSDAKAYLLRALQLDPQLSLNLKQSAPELLPLLTELTKNE